MDSCSINAVFEDLDKGIMKIRCTKTGAHSQHYFVLDKGEEEVKHKNIFEN